MSDYVESCIWCNSKRFYHGNAYSTCLDCGRNYSNTGQMDNLQAEYGSVGNIRWPDPSCVTLHDSEGEEIVVPKCDSCGTFKQMVIGKEAFTWFKQCHCLGKSTHDV